MLTNKSFAFHRLLKTSFSFFTTTFYVCSVITFINKTPRVIQKQHKGGNSFILTLGYSHCILFLYVHSHVLPHFVLLLCAKKLFFLTIKPPHGYTKRKYQTIILISRTCDTFFVEETNDTSFKLHTLSTC